MDDTRANCVQNWKNLLFLVSCCTTLDSIIILFTIESETFTRASVKPDVQGLTPYVEIVGSAVHCDTHSSSTMEY
jgi:hypothetical protein